MMAFSLAKPLSPLLLAGLLSACHHASPMAWTGYLDHAHSEKLHTIGTYITDAQCRAGLTALHIDALRDDLICGEGCQILFGVPDTCKQVDLVHVAPAPDLSPIAPSM